MLVVSVLLLQCALLTLSSAQQTLLTAPLVLTEAMDEKLLQENLFTSLHLYSMKERLNDYLHNYKGNDWTYVITYRLIPNEASRRGEANLYVPLEFILAMTSTSNVIHSRLRMPNRDPLSDESITIDVRADIKIELILEYLDSIYQLTFKNCSLTPEAVRIRSSLMPPELALLPSSDVLQKEMDRRLREATAYGVEKTTCPLIKKWFYNMDQRLANELIDLILREDSTQDPIGGGAK